MRSIAVARLLTAACHDIFDGRFPYVCPESTTIAALSIRDRVRGAHHELVKQKSECS